MSKHKKHESGHHAAEEPELDTVHSAAHEDEFVYVPRGKSKLFYVFILILMGFTLIIFVVPDQFQALFRPQREVSDVYLAWEHPTEGTVSISPMEFQQELRSLNLFFSLQPIQNARELVEDESVIYFMITDELAKVAGVEITDAEVGRAILEGSFGFLGGMGETGGMLGMRGTLLRIQAFGTSAQYKDTMRNWDIATTEYEGTLRRVLRVMRYQNLLGTVVGHADPADIESTWMERHEEFSFDVASVAVAGFEETARGALASDEELSAWYDAQPPRSGTFADDWIAAGTSAEVFGWSVAGDEDVSGLLAAFPTPEGTDLETAAREYYDSVYHARFRREEPLTEGEDPNALIYQTYDEVHDQALTEAPIQFALNAFLQDVTARLAAGETVDVAAEATGFGLHHEPAGEPRSAADWRALDAWGGPYLGNALSRAGDQDLVDAVVVERSGIYFGRVTERRDAGPAPFEDVRDEVIDAWASEQAGELALARAEELATNLAGTEVTVDSFAGGALESGLSVERFDWFDPNAPLAPGVELSELESRARQASASGPEENDLTVASLDVEGDRAWILRCAGRRPPTALKIVPSEYQNLRGQAASKPYERLFGTLLTLESYRARYALVTPGLNRYEDPEPAVEG